MIRTALLLVMLAACGDNITPAAPDAPVDVTDATSSDAAVDAPIDATISACGQCCARVSLDIQTDRACLQGRGPSCRSLCGADAGVGP